MQYDLVFEGGGAKGFVFVGAMQEFEHRGHTHGRLLGTSAGAITACLLAAGYRSDEMLAAMNEKEYCKSVFTKFMGAIPPVDEADVRRSSLRALLGEINFGLVPDKIEAKLDDHLANILANRPNLNHFYSFMEYGGWYSADAFLVWLERKLYEGLWNDGPRRFGGMTLNEFHNATGKDLSLVAADTSAGQLLVLNHRTSPDLPVVRAVRMSMSIPLLWQEVVWKKEWGKYRTRNVAGHSIVDGGLLSNFPLELFLSDMPDVTAVMGRKRSEHVLGLLIDERLPVKDAPAQPKKKKGPAIDRLPAVQRLNGLLNTVLGARDTMVMNAFEDCVIHLPAQGYGTTEFDMSDRRREALVAAGQAAMQAYFKRRKTARAATTEVSESLTLLANRSARSIIKEPKEPKTDR